MPRPFYQPGRYVCRLGKHAVIEKPKGPQLVLKFQVLGTYDHNGQAQEIVSYERTFYRTFNENTMQYAIEDLKSLGFSAPKFSALDPDGDDPFSFDGIQCEMYCSHERDQNGEDRERWAPARSGGGEIEGKRVDRSALRKLDTLFGKALGNTPKRVAQPAAAMAEHGVSDDDVPF